MNAQPYYVITDHNFNSLIKPKGFDMNTDNFIEFLDKGLEEFKKNNK